MPELPEVETIRRSLEKHLIGHRIETIQVRDKRLRVPVDVDNLTGRLQGRIIQTLGRRGKYLLIHVEEGRTLVIHLGMSGRLLYLPEVERFAPHDHVQFTLDNHHQLRFRDHRRFGFVDAIDTSEIATVRYLRHLGIEPLSKECHAEILFERSRKLKKPIKNFLMDAEKIVGIGNIYASEALFEAGIHPKKAAGRLSLAAWEKLNRAIKKVLRHAIRKGGTTFSDFQDSNGEAGLFQVSLRVYQREGEPCKSCGKSIRKIVLSNRSTYYCPECQN